MKTLSENWKNLKKSAAEFAHAFIALFDCRNEDFSCKEQGEAECVVFYRRLLAGAVLLGAVLRIFVFLSEPQLGRDAVYYLNVVRMWADSGFNTLVEYDSAFYIPPVMLGFIKLPVSLGCSPLVSGVTLNLLAGICLIPLVYFIVKYLLDSRKAAVIGAFLTSFNPVLIEYSSNVMRENFMMLFMAAGLLCIILGLRKKDIWFLPAGFFVCWSVFSRYEALEMLPLLGLSFLFFVCTGLFTFKKLLICGIWLIIGFIAGYLLLMLFFNIPADFYMYQILKKMSGIFL